MDYVADDFGAGDQVAAVADTHMVKTDSLSVVSLESTRSGSRASRRAARGWVRHRVMTVMRMSAPNPNWSRTYGRQSEILDYIRTVAT
ncbi:hypothetical protein [Nocardia thraciensis]